MAEGKRARQVEIVPSAPPARAAPAEDAPDAEKHRDLAAAPGNGGKSEAASDGAPPVQITVRTRFP